MFRIDNPSAVQARPPVPAPGTPGYFTNGNPANAQEATIVDDWWMNQIQEELLTVIEQAGLMPDKNSTTQLLEALNALFGASDDLGNTYLQINVYREWESPKQTAGSATNYTVTYVNPPTALVDGMTHLLEFHITNGAQAVLNVNALGNRPIHYYSVGQWRTIPPGLFGPNQQLKVAYHAGSGAYRLTGWQDTTGDYLPTGRAAARLGTILATGQQLDRVQYAGLFAAYGTTYGQGNGSTTFNMPDLRGRVVAGTDQGAQRLINAINGTLASVGGVEQVQYQLTGSAPSQQVTGTASITGTANTNGMDVHSTGRSANADAGSEGAPGSGVNTTRDPHSHLIDIHGSITGNASVSGSGPVTGATGGGPITGTTDNRTNLPPMIVGNYCVAL
jgi:microcystin-dependent protein